MRTKGTQSKELVRIGKMIVHRISESLIQYGVINPEGKSEEQLRSEINKCIRLIADGKQSVKWTIDYGPTLLKEARRHIDSDKELSCLFYAIWFEHWLNHTIHTVGIKTKIPEETITQIIKDTQFKAKSTWLLRLINLKPINKKHLRKMQSITDMRNSFVHYKWKMIDPDNNEDEKKLAKVLVDTEKTVRYLQHLHNKQFYSGKKKKMRKAYP